MGDSLSVRLELGLGSSNPVIVLFGFPPVQGEIVLASVCLTPPNVGVGTLKATLFSVPSSLPVGDGGWSFSVILVCYSLIVFDRYVCVSTESKLGLVEDRLLSGFVEYPLIAQSWSMSLSTPLCPRASPSGSVSAAKPVITVGLDNLSESTVIDSAEYT